MASDWHLHSGGGLCQRPMWERTAAQCGSELLAEDSTQKNIDERVQAHVSR